MTEIKQKLHKYIDAAEDYKLKAIYTLLESEIESEFVYSEEDLKILDELAQRHQDGTSKSYTVEEVFDMVRQNKKSQGL